VARHGGEFPQDFAEVLALPGIGRSTAGAILALSRGERHAILDGNVKRVLTRHFGVEGYPGTPAVERRLWELSEACTPWSRLAGYTQAVMDLGATVCSRARPVCLLCPVSRDCVARQLNLQDRLPAPKPRVVRPVREAWLVVAMRGGSKVLLERRPPAASGAGCGPAGVPTRAHAEQWCGEQLTGARCRGVPIRSSTPSPTSTTACGRSWCTARARPRRCATTTATAGTTHASPHAWACRGRSRH